MVPPALSLRVISTESIRARFARARYMRKPRESLDRRTVR